jgi:arylamine N-acetyltransferase
MTRRIVVLILLAYGAALGQGNFVWDSNGYFSNYYPWVYNTSAEGWSYIYTPTVSGANSNDYEMTNALSMTSGGSTFVQFLRAATTVPPGTGNYISVEYTFPSTWSLIA